MSQSLASHADTAQIHPPIKQLDQALSFRIAKLAALNERSGSYYFQNAYGLRLNEWRVLGTLAPHKKMSFSQMFEALWIDKGQLSRTIKGMAQRGLLHTQAAEKDARQIDLHITPKGHALHDEVLGFTLERNEAMVGDLSPDECALFLNFLSRVIAHNEALLQHRKDTQ